MRRSTRLADEFYTKPEVALENMLLACVQRTPRVVADFAAGRGELLLAAKQIWVNASVIATDVQKHSVKHLTKEHPDWSTGRCDFLNRRSRSSCKALRDIRGRVDLAVLNPPFSCRGAKALDVRVFGKSLRASTGLAFVLEALPYLKVGGTVIAILPQSSIHSEKDRDAWRFLGEVSKWRVLRELGPREFPDAVARTSVVEFTLGGSSRPKQPFAQKLDKECKNAVRASLLRGGIQMHSVSCLEAGFGVQLVHTTDLINSRVRDSGLRVHSGTSVVNGPAVLLPRVGAPNQKKIVVVGGAKRIALSDCIFAVRAQSRSDANLIAHRLIENWHQVVRGYVGTCAPYITKARLLELLSSLNINCDMS